MKHFKLLQEERGQCPKKVSVYRLACKDVIAFIFKFPHSKLNVTFGLFLTGKPVGCGGAFTVHQIQHY